MALLKSTPSTLHSTPNSAMHLEFVSGIIILSFRSTPFKSFSSAVSRVCAENSLLILKRRFPMRLWHLGLTFNLSACLRLTVNTFS